MDSRYQIENLLGQGGLGSVYRAYDKNLGRHVALKRLINRKDEAYSEEEAKKLLQEAELLSSLAHPNIISLFDAGIDEQGAFLIMELVDGETLTSVVQRGALLYDDYCEVVTQSMEGLMAAHENGFVHRDLKPTNIMVQWFPSGRYQLKILDFGMAKFSPLPSPQSMDQSDAIYGSIYFMAPEQFELGLLDLRTDIYAMGCIYYYCLTGKVPFYGDSAAAVMNSHLQGEPVSLERYRPDLPPSMVNWTMRLLSRKAIQRPANAIEALKEFQKARENPDYLPTTPLGVPKALAG